MPVRNNFHGVSKLEYEAERKQSQLNEARDSLPDLLGETKTEWVRVDLLRGSYSPRGEGEDFDHTAMLASIDAKLPPIIVHREAMRVIDGVHRLGAARMRGDELIEARMFDGSEQEAFILGVQSNISHGLPLSIKDRTTAAERIIRSQRNWSDRAIAEAAGLSAKTVSAVRRRMEAEREWNSETGVRMGRDGRLRPVDSAEGRLKAVEFIKTRPDASLREVARSAGISPSTARDVRNRIKAGQDPIPLPRSTRRRDADRQPVPDAPCAGPAQESELSIASMLDGLKRDPALRFSESGRALLRWMFTHAVWSDEWHALAEETPPHSSYVIAVVARAFAQEWLHFADWLEEQPRLAATPGIGLPDPAVATPRREREA